MPRVSVVASLLSGLLPLLVSSSTALGAASLPGFPKKTGKPIERSAVVADLGGAGEVSVAAVSGGRVVAYGIDGQSAPGFPISIGAKEQAAGDIAAADMDGDRRAELAVATVSGKLFLISNGAVAPGFPITLEGGCASGPSFGDLDGDGKPELLQGDKAGRVLALERSGKPVAGFPVKLGGVVTSSVSVGMLNGDLSLAVGTEAGLVHVLDTHGKPLPGFPLAAHFAVAGAPAFGDLDDDGKPDLVVTSRDWNLYAVDEAGKRLPGFPVVAGFAIDGAPALADLDDDGALEAAFATADGNLYVVNGKGKVLPGFPLALKGRVAGGLGAGDLDRDGKLELVLASSDGLVHAVNAAAKEIRGFPSKVPGELSATPFLARVGREATVAAFAASPDGTLAAVRFEGTTGQAQPSIAWAGGGHDAARSGRFYPSPGRYKDLAVTPKEPRIDDLLRAGWLYFSVDGDKEPVVPISWFKDGRLQKELDGKRELPARTVRKGERWRFELKLGARTAKSPEVKVLNTAPQSPEVRITPQVISRLGPARAEVVKPSTDADGDPVSYRYSWLVDGVPTRFTTPEVPAGSLKKGQRWTLVVIAKDGTQDSAPATADAVVANAAPTAPTVALLPASPRRGDEVKVVVHKPATDLDSDVLKYHYRWTVDGEARNYPEALGTLPAGAPRKAQKIEVTVAAFDGDTEGPDSAASASMVNTPPPAPQVAIEPAAPRTGQPLRAVVLSQKADADGDPVSHRAVWSRGGKPWTGATGPGAMEVPAGEVRPLEKWSVQLIPNDGEADGAPGSAQAQAVNSAPTAPLVTLEPSHPRAATPLEVKLLRPSGDVDGDAVRYAYAWTRGGAAVASAQEKTRLAPPELKKHQKIRVTVTPSDPAVKGAAGSAEVEVENTPPGAPALALEPSSPTAQAPLKAVVTRAAPDDDADVPSYRYQWYRDGALQPFPESQAEVPAAQLKKGQTWTVVARAFDGEAPGPPVSASARIGNTPPPAPKVALSPQRPRRGDGLRAVLTEPVDPDGDVVSYRFEWRRDGKSVALPPSASSVPRAEADAPRKGELWSVEVIASDGLADSKPGRAEVRIANTPPTAPGVSVCDGPVKAGATLTVKLPQPSTDADGDPLSYRYSWTVRGKAAPAFEGKSALLPTDPKKHDVLKVTVTPSDGAESGPPGFAECTVEDTAPSAPEIALEPLAPTAGTGVRVKIVRPGADNDGDPVSYRYAWTRDGVPFAPGGPGSEVKAGGLRRGEVLKVTVTSDDGEVRGGETAASVRVKNTVPAAPRVSLSPQKPVAGSSLACAVVAPKDLDGDPVSLGIAWLRNGQPVAWGKGELPSGVVKKGETWSCESWSDDGFERSPREKASVTVSNSAPAAPEISFLPERPGTGDDLRCQLAAEAKDADGDRLRYQYRWFENGKAVPLAPDPTRVPAEQTRRGRKWRCEVSASDGELSGPATSIEKVIGNSAPAAPRVAMKPRTPKPQAPIECEILQAAADPDGDPVTYRFAWTRDGALHKGSTRPMLAGGQVKSGDLWSCQVSASDGELEGPPASSGDAAVP